MNFFMQVLIAIVVTVGSYIGLIELLSYNGVQLSENGVIYISTAWTIVSVIVTYIVFKEIKSRENKAVTLIKEFCGSRRLDFGKIKSQKGNGYLVIASQVFQNETTTYLLHLVVADDRVLEADRTTYSENTDKMISYFARFK